MFRLPILLTAILISLVILRIILMALFAPHITNGGKITYTTTLLSEPKVTREGETVKIWYGNSFGAVPITLTVSNTTLHYGDTVAISGNVQTKVLGNKKVILAMQNPEISLDSQKNSVVLALSNTLRQKIKNLYEKSFSPFFSTLLLGIVLGGSGGFTKSEISQFQTAGVMHVVAASGMNVTLVSGFLLGLFGLFGLLGRREAIALTLFGLFLYVCLAGFQASILRAAIMGAMMLLGQALGRQYNGLYGLIFAGSIMLLVSPTLIADIGFQLSFAASLGIFLIKPRLPFAKIIGDDIGTSIAAQIATLPILLTSLGTYGLLSILVNALVLWTIPVLMIIGGVGAFIGLLIEPLGRLILLIAWPFLFYFQQVINFFSGFNLNFQIQNLSIFIVVGYYLLLGSWVLVIKEA